MLINICRFITLLTVALLTGLAFAHVLERPAKMATAVINRVLSDSNGLNPLD